MTRVVQHPNKTVVTRYGISEVATRRGVRTRGSPACWLQVRLAGATCRLAYATPEYTMNESAAGHAGSSPRGSWTLIEGICAGGWMLACSCSPSLRGADAPEPAATVVVMPPAAAPAATLAAASELQPQRAPQSIVPTQDHDLHVTLRNLARQAASLGLLPVVFIGKQDCEPCESLKQYRTDARMKDAFAQTLVIEIDLDQWSSSELMTLGLSPRAIPVLYVLDPEGNSKRQSITGGAWGDDIPENMAPPLKEFFSLSLGH